MNKTQAKRLLNVAKALRESPQPKKFTMNRYAHDCGTPGCALGHYAARRDLQKLLKLNPNGLLRFAKDEEYADYINPKVAKHFGLELVDAFEEGEDEELFGSRGCGGAKTPIAAARYIEKFVARKMKDGAR